ncbi:MAG: hypothetical protein RL172_1947 [Bacteroidota bacterium]
MKKSLFTLLFSVAFCTGLLAQVIIYSDCNYRGQSSVLGPGNYYNASQFRLSDNNISSIYIPRGCRVELYANANMAGRQLVLTSSNSCLPAVLNDKTSSIRITYSDDIANDFINPQGGVLAYTACDFQGHRGFLPPGDYRSLNAVIGNDAISSLRVPQGIVIELFRDVDFKGSSSGKITTHNQCLANYWNNNASSAKVYYDNGGWLPPTQPPPPSNGGNISIYSGCSYLGRSVSFSAANYNDLRTQLGNSPAGSVQVPAGITVEFYSGYNFSGYLMGRYSNNQSCLPAALQFGAGSMRVYRNNSGPGSGNSNAVTFYSGCSYTGSAGSLPAGKYSSLSGRVIPSSIKLSAGYTVELFTGVNYTGTTTGRLSANNSCLDGWIRGRARSAIIRYQNEGGTGQDNNIIVYASCAYSGRSEVLTVGRYSNLYGRVNPSSVKIPDGYAIEFFTGSGFTGTSTGKLTSNNSCLGSWISGRVQSMVVTYNNGNNGNDDNGSSWGQGITLYSGCNYTGAEKMMDAGYYDQLTSRGPGDVTVYPSAVRVPRGYRVTLYAGMHFSGNSMVLTADADCMSTNWRGRARSAIVTKTPDWTPSPKN